MERILEKRKKRQQKMIEGAREWAGKLRPPLTAVIIGSYARGDFGEWSDIDIIVISPHFSNMEPHERILMLNPPPGLEPIPLTPEEWNWGIKHGKPHVLEAVKKGIVLRDDLGLLRNARTNNNS